MLLSIAGLNPIQASTIPAIIGSIAERPWLQCGSVQHSSFGAFVSMGEAKEVFAIPNIYDNKYGLPQ